MTTPKRHPMHVEVEEVNAEAMTAVAIMRRRTGARSRSGRARTAGTTVAQTTRCGGRAGSASIFSRSARRWQHQVQDHDVRRPLLACVECGLSVLSGDRSESLTAEVRSLDRSLYVSSRHRSTHGFARWAVHDPVGRMLNRLADHFTANAGIGASVDGRLRGAGAGIGLHSGW